MMTSYNVLQPIGSIITGSMTLGDYLEKMFFLLIGVSGVLAVVMLVICGIKLMMSEGAGGREAAKKCIWDAIFGLLIAIGAWLLLNTINPQLVGSTLTMDITLINTQATPSGSITYTEPNPTETGCHFKYREPDGKIRFSKNPTCSACETIRENFIATRAASADPSKEIEVLSQCYEVKASGPAPTPPSTSPGSQTGSQCTHSGRNLCEPLARSCKAHPNCTSSTYAGWAQSAASNAGHSLVTKQLIMAIFVQESSCGTNVKQSSAGACGPTQFKPDTARMVDQYCGVNFDSMNDAQVCSWMNNQANWEKSFCMTAFYIRQIAQMSSCDGKLQNVIASYNGGPGRGCGNSTHCSGDTSCTGGTVKQWECLYDNSAHTECNSGLDESKKYVGNVLYCMGNLGI